jgi:dihydroorotate dehydrogenase
LTQIYTALIYEGSLLLRQINEELVGLLESDGMADVTRVIGIDV